MHSSSAVAFHLHGKGKGSLVLKSVVVASGVDTVIRYGSIQNCIKFYFFYNNKRKVNCPEEKRHNS